MRKSLLGLLLVVAIGSSGCYGPFELTRKLWKWNGSVGDKWVNEGVFLVCNIVPVYGVCAFLDAVVLNSVKFWTGKSALQSKTVEQGDMKAVMTGNRDTGLVQIDFFRNGALERTVVVRPGSDGTMQAWRSDGKRMSARTLGDGSVAVTGEDGKVVAMHASGEADRYTR